MRGEHVSFRDTPDEGIIGASGEPPPVVVAAGGRRMTELAGEVGDEAFLLTGFDERILAMASRHFADGAKRSGRSLESDFKVSHYTVVRIEDDREAGARVWPRPPSWLAEDASSSRTASWSSASPNPHWRTLNRFPAAELDRLVDAFFLIGPVEKSASASRKSARRASSTACS